MEAKPCPHCKQPHPVDQDQVHCQCGALLQRIPDGWKVIAWQIKKEAK